MTSIERVTKLINGEKPDRVPLFDLLRNDDAIEYYSGEKLTFENAQRLTYKATSVILDATRPNIKYPVPDQELLLPDGRKSKISRWTTWNEHMHFADEDAYAQYLKKTYVDGATSPERIQKSAEGLLQKHMHFLDNIGDTFLFWSAPGVGLLSMHGDVGLDQFSYYIYDCPEAVEEALEVNSYASVEKIKKLDQLTKDSPYRPLGFFMAEDIAFKGTTMFSPSFFRQNFFPHLKRICDAIHSCGFKLIFHSDGNLMGVLDDLVEAGIDLLNPIETAAGMDIKEIHRRYPNLIMTGGIDVSQLLPFGTPEEIRAATIQAIEDAEGKIMIGSSTEMQHEVPLENVRAIYETAQNYRY